jgi:integrase
VAQRRVDGVSNHTISKEVDMLIAALRLAKRAGCYPADLEALRPPDLTPGYEPRKRALTIAELAALLPELPARRAAFVQVTVGLGARRSEAFALEPTHLDLDAGSALIPGRKTPESWRRVPVLSPFRTLLEAARPHLPLDPWPNLSRDLERACERAGIERCTPNDLRRTHATMLVEAGVDRDVVRRLLGHTTTAMTDRVYGQPRVKALAALAEQAIESTQHLRDTEETEEEKLSRLRDLNSRPTVYESEPGPSADAASSQKRELSASSEDGEPPGAGASATSTRHPRHPAHPLAVWALALAADRVLTSRTFVVREVVRKGARRAG